MVLRGSKGYGWYNKFIEQGEKAFLKNVPPTPFNWEANKTVLRPKAFFDIALDKEPMGRLTFELASDVMPVATLNFLRLCLHRGKFTYRGTKVHRIHKNIALMGGDVERNDGTGNHSSFDARHFEDENFIIPHSGRGLLSMASVGIDTNGSQFYISFTATTHMNGRCPVFGRLVEGEQHLKAIESLFTFRGAPSAEVVIAECGAEDHESFMAENDVVDKMAATA